LAADSNEIFALLQLGNLLLAGTMGKKDLRAGVAYLEKAAYLGSNEAMIRLIKYYTETKPMDVTKVLKWIEASAKNGYTTSMIRLGRIWVNGHYGLPVDISQAKYWFEQAVKAGAYDAALSFGKILFAGSKHFPQDRTQGIEWICKAAKMGSAHAMAELNRLIVDDPQKDKWLRQVAEAGVPEAMYRLGACLLNNPAEKDRKEGMEWICKAATMGSSEAMKKLDRILMHNPQKNMWLRKVAEAGVPKAMYWLGVSILKNLAEKDKQEGWEWLKKAADAGLAEAKFEIGSRLLHGNECTVDVLTGQTILENLMEQQFVPACFLIGKYKLHGIIVKQDIAKGIEILESLAEQKDHTGAMVQLDGFYYKKQYHFEQAMIWLKRAVNRGSYLAMYRLGKMLIEERIDIIEGKRLNLRSSKC
jgi:TPR repeat protein